MSNLDLSIIIPNFNSGDLLLSSLDSLLTIQSGFFEVIIIDNCSDDFPDDLNSFYPSLSVKVFREHDTGVYDAMNKGIKLAQGEWIYFLGAGDRMLIASTDFLTSIEDHLLIANVWFENKNQWESGESSLFDLLRCNVCHQRIFYRRSVFPLIGNFNLRYPIMSDYDFNIRCFLYPLISVGYLSIPVAAYLGGGMSSLHSDQKLEKAKPGLVLHYFFKFSAYSQYWDLISYYFWLIGNKISFELQKFKI